MVTTRAPAPFGAGGLVEKGSDLDKALRAGNWERAEQLLVKKIEAAPQSADLLKLLARVFLADRRPLNAAIAIKKAEAIAPLDNQTRYELAIAYLVDESRRLGAARARTPCAGRPGESAVSVLARAGSTTTRGSTRPPPSGSRGSSKLTTRS